MKTCTKCRKTKPLEDFNLDARRPDGRTPVCKACASAGRRAHYEANRERMRRVGAERNREWREKNPERARKRSTESSRQLRERDPSYFRRWYWEHAEQQRQRSRETMRHLRETRPELEQEWRRRYHEAHPERIRNRDRAKTQQRRARKAATASSMFGGYSTQYMVEYMAALITEPCEYCGEEGTTIDHVVPLARGGLHIPANLVSACFSCNSSKCNRLLHEWPGRRAALKRQAVPLVSPAVPAFRKETSVCAASPIPPPSGE